jgi:hypothetical protein
VSPAVLSALLLLSASANPAVSQADSIAGVYAGTILCADCSGIATRIVLTAGLHNHGTGGNYTESEINLDAPYTTPGGTHIPDRVDRSRGTWTLLPAAAGLPPTLRLTARTSDGKKSYDEFHVVGSQLFLTNGSGADLSPRYPRTLVKMTRLQDGHDYPDLPTAAPVKAAGSQ